VPLDTLAQELDDSWFAEKAALEEGVINFEQLNIGSARNWLLGGPIVVVSSAGVEGAGEKVFLDRSAKKPELVASTGQRR
jgi:hypothetical protein